MFISELIKNLIPEYERSELSYLSLCTTNPVYLVFEEKSETPIFVVRLAKEELVIQTFKVLERLYLLLGNLVPRPIAVSQIGENKVTIVEGVKGAPWFQLGVKYSTKEQWDELRLRGIAALNTFQKAVAKIDEWNSTFELGYSLRSRLVESIDCGVCYPQIVKDRIRHYVESLDSVAFIGQFSHGDYCINNLMIEEELVHIIDFDDFGITSAPLHDEFSYALSMFTCRPKKVNSSLKKELKKCIQLSNSKLESSQDIYIGLFIHHLLLRLGKWSEDDRRKDYRNFLLSLIEEVVKWENIWDE